MTESSVLFETVPLASRRRIFGAAVAFGAAAIAAKTLAQSASPTGSQFLNLSLNVNYLFGQYLSYGLNGTALNANETRGIDLGSGGPGVVTGARQVTIPTTDTQTRPILSAAVAVNTGQRASLRGIQFATLVAQPAIDLSPATFTTLMRAAGATGAGETFDPYASADNFLLGAYIIADLATTCDQGVAARIADGLILGTALGLASAKAAVAAGIRSLLYRRGLAAPSIFAQADAIAAQRDRYDGTATLDAGLSPRIVAGATVSRIVPGNGDAMIPNRSPEQVLNILYLTNSAVSRGGFFPNGVAGTLVTSGAN